jgi:hypothetical protein
MHRGEPRIVAIRNESTWKAWWLEAAQESGYFLALRRPPQYLKCLLSKLTKEKLSSSNEKATSAFVTKKVPAFHGWLLQGLEFAH